MSEQPSWKAIDLDLTLFEEYWVGNEDAYTNGNDILDLHEPKNSSPWLLKVLTERITDVAP